MNETTPTCEKPWCIPGERPISGCNTRAKSLIVLSALEHTEMATATIFPMFIGGLGPVELGVIFLIAVLLFGANKIPQLARSTGEAMGEFKKGREEVERELEEIRDMAEEEMETAEQSTSDDTAAEEPS